MPLIQHRPIRPAAVRASLQRTLPRSFSNKLAGGALVMALASCSSDMTTPVLSLDPGVSWALAEHRSRTISELRYDFDLRIPAERSQPIEGRGVIRFHWEDPAALPMVMDFLEPHLVHAVSANGQETLFERVNDHLVIPSDHLLNGVENEVVLTFTAGEGSLNRNDEFLYTLFVPERARFSLPLFDQPNLKGRFAVTLTVPEGWTAVANGPLLDEQTSQNDGEANVTTLRFAESLPLPTYLFAFAAGRFKIETAVRDGREMRFFHRETDVDRVERNLDEIFDLHATALAWLEEYTGIAYPFQKFDFVGIPSFQYGGMEHAGAILYRASSLFLDESATQAQYLGRASVIAHETAHMWFGDLVTMNWFDDVWMKEVFANFMAAKIVQPSFPEINHDLRFLSHHQGAYAVDRTSGTTPIRQELDNLKEAGTLYGAIIYQKAPVVMQLLERMIGQEAFREGMQQYLTTFSYDNATWLDLVEILDLLSPEDISGWSRVWVEDAGRPRIDIVAESDDDGTLGQLIASQQDPAGHGRLWPQPLGVGLGYGTEIERVEVRLFTATEVSHAAAGRPMPDFLLPESEGVAYGHFVLDDRSREYLLERVSDLENPVVRGVAWLTLWDAVLDGEADATRFLEQLLRGVTTETDELNLARVLRFLEDTFWTLLPTETRLERSAEIEAVLWDRLISIPTTTARSSLFATYRDIALTEDALARLQRIWEREERVPGVTLSENDFTTLTYELAVRGVPGWSELLDAQAERIENEDRRARFEFVRPALAADLAARALWFNRLVDPAAREREPWVLTGLAYLHHPLRSSDSEQHILPSLELVEEIQRTGDIFFPARWLNTTLGRYNTREAAATVRAFLEGRPEYPPRLQAKILQAADRLYRSAEIVG